LRVIADPAALDGARWQGDDVTVLRFAPDDAFAIGASAVEVDDADAIVESETGFVGAWVSLEDVLPHIEWSVPDERPALAQGSVVSVPAKLWLPATDDGAPHADTVLLLSAAAYAHELAGRLR
jgi:hypothetical protein